MIVAGVDPGTIKLGLCIIDDSTTQLRVLLSDLMQANPKVPKWRRIGVIAACLRVAFKIHKPDVVAIEKAYVGKNAQSALAIGEARGAVFVVATEFGARVVELTPAEARRSAFMKGNADKEAIRRMAVLALGLPASTPLDVTDAAAIAIAGSAKARSEDMIRNAHDLPLRQGR